MKEVADAKNINEKNLNVGKIINACILPIHRRD